MKFIYNSVSSDIRIPQSGLKNEAQPSVFFKPLQGVWIPDETLFQVFDIASQTDCYMRGKQRKKIAKIYAN